MSSEDFTHIKLTDVADSAPSFGIDPSQQSRFANSDLQAERTGVSHHRFAPGARQSFGHRHDEAEEVYVVLSGSGRMKLGDEILEIELRDAIRVAPAVVRAFEAGPDGLEVLAVGARHEGDGELLHGWWAQ